MITVLYLDSNKFFTGVSEVIDKKDFNNKTMTELPLLTGYIKPRLTGGVWLEGATVDEIKEWEDSQALDKKQPSNNERLAQLEEIVMEMLLMNIGG